MQSQPEQIWAVLTIDTEADNAWEDHLNPGVANVPSLWELARLLRQYSAKATCLISYRVANDEGAVSVLRALVDEGLVEIGAHLHPWENPPFMESGLDRRYHAYPHELPLELFKRKMEMLTARIAESFASPRSYRAGRWGLAAEHVKVLEDLGYEVDTSVTPLIIWLQFGLPASQGGRGGCDYRRAPLEPYWLSHQDVTRPGESKLVELPVTVQFTHRIPLWLRRVYPALPEWVRRVLRKGLAIRPVWAFAAEEKNKFMEQMLECFASSPASFFNMSVHSSELMLGTSPRSRTPQRIGQTLRNIQMALSHLSTTGHCNFCTLTQAARIWKTQPTPALAQAQTAAAPTRLGRSQCPASE
jgi:hypothetical protein